MKEKPKHYALIQKNGKHATRRGQAMIATRIEAVRIDRSGRGGGIVNALLPQNEKETKILSDAENKYAVKLVDSRKKGDSKSSRETVVADDYLMEQLGERYADYEMRKYGKRFDRVDQFSIWICDELQKPKSPAQILINSRNPALAERLKPSWWEKQIADRRRRFRELEKLKRKTAS